MSKSFLLLFFKKEDLPFFSFGDSPALLKCRVLAN
jgi:hypothetical protein